MGAYLAWSPTSAGGITLPQTLFFDVVTTENPSFPTQVAEHVVEKGPDVADNVRVGLRSLTLEVFVTNEPIDPNPQWGTGVIAPMGPIDTDPTGALEAQPLKLPGLPVLTQATWFTLPIGVPLLNMLTAHEVDVPFVPNVGLQPTRSQIINPRGLTFPIDFDAVSLTHDLLDSLRQSAQLITVYGSKGTYENMVIEHFEMNRDDTTGTGASFTIALKEIRIVTTDLVAAPTPTKARGNSLKHKGSQSTEQPAGSFQSWLYSIFNGFGHGQTTAPQPAEVFQP